MIAGAQFLPLVGQLGAFLKMGLDHYSDLRAAGKQAGPEIIAMFLEAKMANWNPMLSGKPLLDSETRAAGARFLGGVAVNFTSS